MALQFELKAAHPDNHAGGTHKKLYLKVENVKIDVNRNQADITVRGYATEKARKENKNGEIKKLFKVSLEELGLGNLTVEKGSTLSDAIKGLAYTHIKGYFKDTKNI